MALLMVATGIICVLLSCLHGYLGETKLIGPAQFPSRQARLLVSAIWQFSTAMWIVSGVLIAMSPWLFPAAWLTTAIALICAPLLFGVIANCVITRGRHFGWMAFLAVIVAAMLLSFLQ